MDIATGQAANTRPTIPTLATGAKRKAELMPFVRAFEDGVQIEPQKKRKKAVA